MKKALLQWNVRFYIIIYSIIAIYAGSKIEQSLLPFVERLHYFLPVVIYLVLLAVGNNLAKKPQYAGAYLAAGIATLLVSSLRWGLLVVWHNAGLGIADRSIDYIGCPAAVWVGSVLIAVFYIICAVITRREHREAAAA